MKIINYIGAFLSAVGIILFGVCAGHLAQGTATDLSNRLLFCGILLSIAGIVMANTKKEWFFNEED